MSNAGIDASIDGNEGIDHIVSNAGNDGNDGIDGNAK